MENPKLLFVCLGNICRSPTAEAVFRACAARSGLEVEIDSAGTGAWHAGEPPDERAQAAGHNRGYSFDGQTARAVTDADFLDFDLILAMDAKNLKNLQSRAPDAARSNIHLFLDFAPHLSIREVPDPYYGGADGFDHVLDLIEAASDGLIAHLS